MLVCPITANTNFDNLVKMDSAWFLHGKVIVFPL